MAGTAYVQDWKFGLAAEGAKFVPPTTWYLILMTCIFLDDYPILNRNFGQSKSDSSPEMILTSLDSIKKMMNISQDDLAKSYNSDNAHVLSHLTWQCHNGALLTVHRELSE